MDGNIWKIILKIFLILSKSNLKESFFFSTIKSSLHVSLDMISYALLSFSLRKIVYRKHYKYLRFLSKLPKGWENDSLLKDLLKKQAGEIINDKCFV